MRYTNADIDTATIATRRRQAESADILMSTELPTVCLEAVRRCFVQPVRVHHACVSTQPPIFTISNNNYSNENDDSINVKTICLQWRI